MLRIWRGPKSVFAECTTCGSFGTANHAQLQANLSPDLVARLDAHAAHLGSLRDHFMSAVKAISEEVRNGSKPRNEASEQVRSLWENFHGQIQLVHAASPKIPENAGEVAVACPWCGHPEQVDVELLPEGQAEPDYELAKPVKAHLDALLQADLRANKARR